jgi:hypothetical protein
MTTRRWVDLATLALHESLHPVPAELNELDWKAALSTQRERLVEHLIAMANLRNGGTLTTTATRWASMPPRWPML